MLIFRNMREMTKDEIKVFLREGRKIGCAVHTKAGIIGSTFSFQRNGVPPVCTGI